MSKQCEFRKRAADLAELAGQTDDLEHVERYLRVASFWVQMAENEYWLHHNSLSALPRSSRRSGGGAS